MKTFRCNHCDNVVFFENTQCLRCGALLAYLPDLEKIGSLTLEGDLWRSPLSEADALGYHLCQNYTQHGVCNEALSAASDSTLCRSCQFTELTPDLSVAGNLELWAKLTVAQRRLLYTLFGLSLPLTTRSDDPEKGLAFHFLADGPEPVKTGHADGVITLNIAEADDAEREKRRQALGEEYRTLLGHFRHEIGHFFWDRLIADDPSWLKKFRREFGDERSDYGQALNRHYNQGPPADWEDRFITPYAASHPWEDWAESWAHYLHMTDVLETASNCGMSLRPRRKDEPTLAASALSGPDRRDFDTLVDSWFSVTYALNSLNRSIGLQDAYPFVLPDPVIAKLRFIHERIEEARRRPTRAA